MLKKTLIWSAIALSSFVFTVTADRHVKSVHNNKEFGEAVESKKYVLVKFFSPSCGHCKDMQADFETAARMLKEEPNLGLAEVDCTINGDLCGLYGVQAYPTLQLFDHGVASELYASGRKSHNFVQYMKQLEEQPVPLINKSEQLEKLKQAEPLVIAAYVDPEDLMTKTNFEMFTEGRRQDFSFVLIEDKELAKQENVTTFPTIVLYKHFDHLRDEFHPTAPDDSELEEFIRVNSVPFLDDVTDLNFMDYVDAGKPLVYIFTDSEEQKQDMHDIFLPLAKELRGRYNFVHISAVDYPTQAFYLSLKPKKWPAIAVHDIAQDAKYPLEQTTDLHNKEVVLDFLNQISEGKREPSIRSQSLVRRSTQVPVKIVVGDTFEEIVMDKTKDVFIDIYAPWCGHCRKMEPEWEELGETMKKFHAEEDYGVVIAKMDGTENDVPHAAGLKVNAYPTLRLFKADNTIVEFQGERTLEGFIKFINEHSTKPTNFDLNNIPSDQMLGDARDEL